MAEAVAVGATSASGQGCQVRSGCGVGGIRVARAEGPQAPHAFNCGPSPHPPSPLGAHLQVVFSVFCDRPFSWGFFAQLHDEGCFDVAAVEDFDAKGMDRGHLHMHLFTRRPD